jgi:predicted phage tail protein
VGTRIIEILKANTLYTIQVRAKNVFGKWGAFSTAATITTAKDTTAPSAPAGQTILVATPNFFVVGWTASASGLGVEGYNIYVYTSNTPASAKIIKRAGYNTTRIIVNQGEASEDASITITAGTAYWFWITSVDQSGNESAKSTLVTGTLGTAGTGTDHGALTGLLDDDHTQYRLESADHTHQTTGAEAGKIDHGLALDGLLDDDHTQYQKESEKDAVSGYAGLNASSRTTKGVDTTDDLIIDLAAKGLVLKDTQGTPHYWRVTIDDIGSLVTTDLGTVKP